ncbi:MAG TPA: hypothetical protein VJZ71_08720 [Phycisphaerae bacterium]|nr:hypothetical protein [Phycisphaerae bacterium]
MSDDEKVVLIGASVGSILTWGFWYARLFTPKILGKPAKVSSYLGVIPVAALFALFFLLRLYSASDVRSSGVYTFFYMVLGAAWIGLFVHVSRWCGIGVREDVAERRNSAAAWVIGGAIIGLSFCYAGGNFGDGPGWWVVLFCAGLATGAFFLEWSMVQLAAGIADQVTIDRSIATGIRFAAFLCAIGAVLGRAVSGDWHSTEATLIDFLRNGWHSFALVALECVIGKSAAPSPERPGPNILLCGVIPAFLYLAVSAVSLYWLGDWR